MKHSFSIVPDIAGKVYIDWWKDFGALRSRFLTTSEVRITALRNFVAYSSVASLRSATPQLALNRHTCRNPPQRLKETKSFPRKNVL